MAGLLKTRYLKESGEGKGGKMEIKNLSKRRLKNRMNYLQKTNPKSRWIPYVKYHLRKKHV